MSNLPANVLPRGHPDRAGENDPAETKRGRQLLREKSARDAALGRRAKAVGKGDLGPVLRRWVSGSVVPVAARLRAGLAGGGSLETALSSPLFGVPQQGSASGDLRAVTDWFLKPGNGDDLVLAVLGTVISNLAVSSRPLPLTAVLSKAAESARETALGQFITQVQGAKAMMKVRTNGKASWKQAKGLNAVASILGGQVRDALQEKEDLGELEVGKKAVVHIVPQSGEGLRRIDLRPPAPEDWALLDVARSIKGEADHHKSTWVSFAMLVLCAAQAEAGWFDIAEVDRELTAYQRKPGKRPKRKAKGLVLSDSAYGVIKKDLDKWLGLGFTYEPMIVEPELGDYLSVKHREVAGGRGPMGIKTKAKDSAAWHVASETLAKTQWSVNEKVLEAVRDSEFIRGLVPEGVRSQSILNAYRKEAPEPELYMPLQMDFRGRIYTRPTFVTYQGGDLQKSLLVFPPQSRYSRSDQLSSTQIRSVVFHMSNLYGNGLDKAPWNDRYVWWTSHEMLRRKEAAIRGEWDNEDLQDLLEKADEPLQLLSALTLHAPGQFDRIPCQIDGTCNGLQHLSALFRDETAAPFVNLTASSVSDRPCDIYGEIAERVTRKLHDLATGQGGQGHVGHRHDHPEVAGAGERGNPSPVWASRVLAAIKIDRKLCKKPVMVLPYGGTRGTIEDEVFGAMLGQAPIENYWREGLVYGTSGLMQREQWPDYIEGNYAAFNERELKDHPLFLLDAKRLAGVIWDTITEMLPKAMAAMQTFRDIAKAVGDRTLEWDTGYAIAPLSSPSGSGEYDSLWVTQAKAKAARSTLNLKGYHLPATIRGLSIRAGRDEIDPASHTSGIVANFIHSQDAAHLAATLRLFYRLGGRGVGTIHDCFITRPSQGGLIRNAVRATFAERYGRIDPLSLPVYLGHAGGKARKKAEQFASWYALAEACGTSFPEDGAWEPKEVLESAWFFS